MVRLNRLGFSTIIYLPFKAERAIKKLVDHGIFIIEILYEIPQIQNPKNLLKLKKEYDLTFSVHAPFYDINPASLVKEIRNVYKKRIKKCIDFSRKLEAELIVLHPGHYPNFGKNIKEKVKTIFLRNLYELKKYAEKNNIVLTLENESKAPAHKSICYPQLSEFPEVINSLDLKVTFDIGHAFISTKGNIYQIIKNIKALGNNILNVHLHDNDGQEDLHLIPGDGKIPLKRILTKLNLYANHKVQYIIEVGNKGSIYKDDVDVLIEKCLERVKKL